MEKTHPYVRLARATVEQVLRGGSTFAGSSPASGRDFSGDSSLWSLKRACFVSIKTLDGGLRGCIGTILPAYPSLEREIIFNAIAASTRDPRFPPMTEAELDRVSFSVDVLGQSEPVTDKNELDPAIWGVIVSKGQRRGVLLPDLEGVDTADAQISIAAQKAGIYDMQGITIERFQVDRYKEALD